MTVWIVNPFDNLPLEGMRPQRYWLMARAFAAAGWKVVYWSADFSHAAKRVRRTPEGVPLEANGVVREIDGIGLRLVHEPPYPANICLKRIYSHWRLARNWLAAVRELPPPEVVIVSSPPLSVAAAARRFCRRTGAKLVVDIQDAWPETFARVLPRALLVPLAAVARRNYLAADAITAVSRRYLDMARRYGATCPMHLCYHGIEMSGPPTIRSESTTPRLRLAYVGNMSLSYDLATVVRAVKGTPGLELDLAGTGPDEANLRTLAAGCDRLRFHGYLAADALRELLAQAEVGVVPMFDASCVGMPGKFADYAAAGLPIVNSLGGEAAELLAQYGAGVAYEAGNASSFLAAVQHARAIKKESISAFAVEFDAQKLYNAYHQFVKGLFTGV